MRTRTTDTAGQYDREPLLEISGLKKHFSTASSFLDRVFGANNTVYAVDGVSLSIGHKETLGLVGESGCGKSTLGRTIARLYEPTDGKIVFNGEDITKYNNKELKPLRKEVQVIFQDPLSSLNPRKTAGEIIRKPLTVHDIGMKNNHDDRVTDLLDDVGLNETHFDRYPHELSGGQCQRVGIARALAVDPQLIIADEPVSALDASVQAQILNLLSRLQNDYELSYLVVAHDLSVIRHISDQVAVMYLGQLVEQGPTERIYEYAQHPYTRALLTSIPSIEGPADIRDSVLEGNPPSPTDPPSGCPFHTRCPEFIGNECVEVDPSLESVDSASGATQLSLSQTQGDRDSNQSAPSADSVTEHVAACHWLDKHADDRQEQELYNG
jgi:oligopeptide/dipeptide ABC transporter ATP-binding protein